MKTFFKIILFSCVLVESANLVAMEPQVEETHDYIPGKVAKTVLYNYTTPYRTSRTEQRLFVFRSPTNGMITLWDTESGQRIHPLPGYADIIWAVALSPDGTLLASGSNDTVKLWNTESCQCVQTLPSHADTILAIAFSPDGTLLASGSYKTIKLWTVESCECVNTFDGHYGFVRLLAFSQDGRLLASASGKTIELWNIASGEHVHSFDDNVYFVTSLAFSPDGTQIIVGLNNGSTVIYTDKIALASKITEEEKKLALGMTRHSRLGAGSPLQLLDSYLLQQISRLAHVKTWTTVFEE